MTRHGLGSWIGAACGVALALAGIVLAALGTDEKAIRVALDVTARWSFLLFWIAYAGAALALLLGPGFASLGRGREFGVAFAAAHLVHVGLVIWLSWILGRPALSGALLAFFAVGLFWTYLLAALSFGGLVKALGPKRWRAILFVGMNYILIAFARDFVLGAIHAALGRTGVIPLMDYGFFAVMCVAAPLVRVAALARRRRALASLA